MGTQLFRVQRNSALRFLVIFAVLICHSLEAASYVRLQEQAGAVEKYIAKAYFDVYDTLADSEFDHFIENEIPLGLCKVLRVKDHAVPIVSVQHRDIIGEGSHRRLSSSMRLKMQPELKSELSPHSCEVIVIERLPSGVFADPFELQHLVHRGVFDDASVFGDTNLELPSFRSNRSVVEIHMSFASEVLSRNKDDLEVNLEIPLHARYQPLGHDFSRVEFGLPDLFMRCNLEGNLLNRTCLSMPISEHKADSVAWDIPCGKKEHAGIVSAATFGFAAVTALLIIWASIRYPDSTSPNKLKHS